jgi:hypothetical protein
VNANVLLPIGPDSFEPLSSQAFMTGIPVSSRAPLGQGLAIETEHDHN